MLNTWIGPLGHLFVIMAFVSGLMCTISFYLASANRQELEQHSWNKYGQVIYYLHFASILAVIVSLFYIIAANRFEYHYAFSHSSSSLPVYYKISCFWEGQEGSFLLWIFWNSLLGLIVLHTNREWKATVMTVVCLVQAFLLSMILGTVIPILNLKIGSSPFMLLRDVMDAPIFEMNPEFIPEDGNGLNPLLQNYWMVIHPPTLFLGFAATLIPFAYAIAGLWRNKLSAWIRPALPWSLFAAAVLGVGILMGGYWAYETLSFGGYWNWDPVENAVYVPWLVLVASIHVMITYQNSSVALKSSFILVITTFMLILYSTFLTRSGILGESSVHSFTDLGLSGQLLLYLLTFLIGSIAFMIVRWSSIPKSKKEVSTYSREFWIFLGATTLCLMSFQVLFPTSIPVFNSIAEGLGFELNAALPSDQVVYFSKFQLWFAIGIAVLSGTGQFFWWQYMDRKKLLEQLTVPLMLALVTSTIIILLADIRELPYILLLTVSLYSLFANGKVFLRLFRRQPRLSGGAITHMGVALMLIGILFSSGYSRVISRNESGFAIFNDQTENRENILLWLNSPRNMEGFELTYTGKHVWVPEKGEYVPTDQLLFTNDPFKRIARADIPLGKRGVNRGDTLRLANPENTYYRIEYERPSGNSFTLYPRVQENEKMGGPVVSPAIRRRITRDLFTHVTAISEDINEKEWSTADTMKVSPGQTFFINDFASSIQDVSRVTEIPGFALRSEDLAVKATVLIQDLKKAYEIPVYYIIRNMQGWFPEAINESLGISLRLVKILPNENKFVLAVQSTQKDYVVLKAIEKPFINILWIGTGVLVIGFIIAIRRRYLEFRGIK